jgi:D-beta-D-heptose 7-phosphate kinase/D-beta-D-heptose 1-phosphate adenosyltransferase
MTNIWTNGCFDIVHIGHLRLFNYAKSLGTKLIVGIDCDSRIKTNKNPNRPINNQEHRIEFLKHIKEIDDVVLFCDDDDLKNQIKSHKVDIIVVGDDYKNKQVIGSELVKQVIFFPKISNFSSTNIYESIR